MQISNPMRGKASVSKRKQLTAKEVSEFIEKGFIVLRQIFRSELVERVVPLVWHEMHELPDDPSTWTMPVRIVEKLLQNLPMNEVLTRRYRDTLDDLCGVGRWETNDGIGYWINLFPNFANPPWRPPTIGWHIDTQTGGQNTNAPDLALVGMELFSNIDPSGGGTAIRVGSHRYVARVDAEAGHTLSSDDLSSRAEVVTGQLPVVEVTGQAGDVLLMHPFTIHATSPNTRDCVRIAANRPISLYEPLNFNRTDPSSYSPVECAVVDALTRSSLYL